MQEEAVARYLKTLSRFSPVRNEEKYDRLSEYGVKVERIEDGNGDWSDLWRRGRNVARS
jgi:hypothetical protein